MSTTRTEPDRAPTGRVAPGPRRPPPTLLVALTALAVGLGVLARLWSPSALWLDEALSVGIASRPVPGLLRALRQDGSPPLYYLLLHGWTAVVGTSAPAVRALSTLFSLATLPLVWRAGRRLGGRGAATAALLVVAASPFAVRYATETRMYALLQLLCAAGVLAVLRALERPTAARLAPVTVLSGMLALTHYWALFLLAATAGLLLTLGVRGSRPARRALAALAAGGVLFLPWLPTFLFQVQHTGTPWAPTPHLSDVWTTLTGWAGGGSTAAVLLTLVLAALVVLALYGRPVPPGGRAVVLAAPADRTALALLTTGLGTVALGLVAGIVLSAGYALRYSSVAFIPTVLLVGLGVRALPARLATGVLALAAVAGLAGSLPQLTSTRRTQAAVTAAALRDVLQPGDVVAYCPDQLGPAVSRLLPPGTDQVVYPTFASPELVDWVDYAQRHAQASPVAFAAQLVGRTRGAVLLVSAGGYLTFGQQCEELATALTAERGTGTVVSRRSGAYDEQQGVVRYPPAGTATGVVPAP